MRGGDSLLVGASFEPIPRCILGSTRICSYSLTVLVLWRVEGKSSSPPEVSSLPFFISQSVVVVVGGFFFFISSGLDCEDADRGKTDNVAKLAMIDSKRVHFGGKHTSMRHCEDFWSFILNYEVHRSGAVVFGC